MANACQAWYRGGSSVTAKIEAMGSAQMNGIIGVQDHFSEALTILSEKVV
jgi:hypothetical protein